MVTKIETFSKPSLKRKLPDVRPGDTVRVYQKIPAFVKTKAGKKETDKEKIQIFEGVVIARKHGKEIGATITVRKVISGIGVEKTFPLHSPTIEKIEILKRAKVRRAKLYYLRKVKGKKARLKRKKFVEVIAKEIPEEAPKEVKETEGNKKEKPEEIKEIKKTEEVKNNKPR